MGKLERTRRGASFTNLFASAARPTPTDPRIILMALRHDANDANLTRIADDLIGLRETVEKMDHAQDALLVNGNSLQGQVETLSGLIAHMIEVLTPERPEQEGPSLADLLSRSSPNSRRSPASCARPSKSSSASTQPSPPTPTRPANGAGRA